MGITSILDADNAANPFRRRRFRLVHALIDATLARQAKCRILDIGGTTPYWRAFGADLDWNRIHVTIVNLDIAEQDSGTIKTVHGDARQLAYEDSAFDIVHSNSVIEHVGRWSDQKSMAREVRRLAPAYYVQTPNFWFPVEPHMRAVFFHWLPEQVRFRLLMKKRYGFFPKSETVDNAMETMQSVCLLDKLQMQDLFPDAEILKEKFLGFTKSLIAVHPRTDASSIKP